MSTKAMPQQRPSYDDEAQLAKWKCYIDPLVERSLCERIVEEMSRNYSHHSFTKTSNHIIDSIYKYRVDAYARPLTVATIYNNVRDYVWGAALSINPLPTCMAQSFYTSDVEALRSDWFATRSDLEAVWLAASAIRDQLANLTDARDEAVGDKNDGSTDAGGRGAEEKAFESREAKAARNE